MSTFPTSCQRRHGNVIKRQKKFKFIANADRLGQRTLSFMVILLNAYPAGNGIKHCAFIPDNQKCINGLVFLVQHRYLYSLLLSSILSLFQP